MRATLLIGAMTASGFTVLLFAPELRWYGGLSGVAHAVVVYGALNGSRHRGRRSTLSCAVLAIVAAKLVIDAESVRHLAGSHDGAPIVVARASHLGAVAYSIALFAGVSWPAPHPTHLLPRACPLRRSGQRRAVLAELDLAAVSLHGELEGRVAGRDRDHAFAAGHPPIVRLRV